MNKINQYYEVTEKDKPHKNVKYFIENIKVNPSNAIDLGCGQGNDILFLIRNGWNVLGIDKENVEERIRKRLNKNEQCSFNFELQIFEELKLIKTDLIVANFSLSFCDKKKFENTWKTIEEAISTDGYFIGNFFGTKDSWAKTQHRMTFFSNGEVEKLFNNFKIIHFEEIEADKTTALGNPKHWHFFNVIAKKEAH